MFQKTFYATHPESLEGASNEELRQLYLVEDLFAEGELCLNYSHFDRMVVGGACPSDEKISLPVQIEPESAKDKPFLERRELGAINIGSGKGTITVDGERYELAPKDCLYVPKESADVSFESETAENPAKFYLVSTLAHNALKQSISLPNKPISCISALWRRQTYVRFTS